MKKIAFTVMAGLLLIFQGHAQNEVAEQSFGNLRMAISAAPVVSWFAPDGEANRVQGDGARFSIKYGLHMDFKIGGNDNYFLSTGLFMVNTGGTLDRDAAASRLDGDQFLLELTRRNVDYRINYLTIPLNFKLMTNEVGYNRYFARVGFDLGLAVNSRFDSEDAFSNPAATVSRENASGEDFTRFYRTALHIEGGFEYNIGGNTNLMVSLEWNNGLNNVFTRDKRFPTVSEEAGVRETGDRVQSVINYIALNLGVYF